MRREFADKNLIRRELRFGSLGTIHFGINGFDTSLLSPPKTGRFQGPTGPHQKWMVPRLAVWLSTPVPLHTGCSIWSNAETCVMAPRETNFERWFSWDMKQSALVGSTRLVTVVAAPFRNFASGSHIARKRFRKLLIRCGRTAVMQLVFPSKWVEPLAVNGLLSNVRTWRLSATDSETL